jgi:hypothetical protein
VSGVYSVTAKSIPFVEFVTSDNQNGNYYGGQIDIKVKFSKPVRVI